MTVRDKCVEPKFGSRIKEYVEDMDAPSGEKKLTSEEAAVLELHLIRCSFCRMKLNLKSRFHLETMFILSGFFVNDPVLLEKRRNAVIKFFQDKISLEEFKADGLHVSDEERRKLKALWKKNN